MSSSSQDSGATDALVRLLEVMRRLRDPQTGCSWDREQTFATIVPHTLEEAFELADAVASGRPDAIQDELGDLLFQVVFLAQLAQEQGWFGFGDVAAAIGGKLTRRHPHVFGGQVFADAAEQSRSWESIKAAERDAVSEAAALGGIAAALPALSRAAKLGRRAGRLGFDWPEPEGVRAKVFEEIAEVDAAPTRGQAAVNEEVGDLLFAMANWARHLRVDPEDALRAANRKFEHRFALMETAARKAGAALESLDAAAWDRLWAEAKSSGT